LLDIIFASRAFQSCQQHNFALAKFHPNKKCQA